MSDLIAVADLPVMVAIVRASVAPKDCQSITQRDIALSGRCLCKGGLTFAKSTMDQTEEGDDQGRLVISVSVGAVV